MNKSTAFLVFVSLFLMSSCEKEKKKFSEPAYAKFRITQSKNKRDTGYTCYTTLNVDITKDDTRGKALTFNGEPLEERLSISGSRYYKNFGGCWSEGAFVYEDDSGIYTTSFLLDTIDINPDEDITIKVNEPFELFWEGPPVAENETIYWKPNLRVDAQQSQVGANSIWVTIPDSVAIQRHRCPIDWDFRFVRTKTIKNLQEPYGADSSGELEIEYSSGRYSFNISE